MTDTNRTPDGEDNNYATRNADFAEIPDHIASDLWSASQIIHALAKAKGWWEQSITTMPDGKVWTKSRSDLEAFMLMVTEIAEAAEAWRAGNPMSSHPISLRAIEEEMADVVIRVFDYCAANDIDIGRAVQRKHAYNATRAYRHGGKLA